MNIYIFDIDNTIYSSKTQSVSAKTKLLLTKLASDPNNMVGFATGRGNSKLHVIEDIKHLFKIRIQINGAMIYLDDQLIYNKPLNHVLVEKFVSDAFVADISVGMVSIDDEAVTFLDENVLKAYVGFNRKRPKADPFFFQTQAIYQLWVSRINQQEALDFITPRAKDFQVFRWRHGGFDLTDKHNSKKNAVLLLKDKFPSATIICLGDGHNDIDMLKVADIGVALKGGDETILSVATKVAPSIDEDMLLDFFEREGLF